VGLSTGKPNETEHTWPVDFRRRRTANGGWEWFFQLDRRPMYPGTSRVGLFTDPNVSVEGAFAQVVAQWARTGR
jgi:hypothetical protein